MILLLTTRPYTPLKPISGIKQCKKSIKLLNQAKYGWLHMLQKPKKYLKINKYIKSKDLTEIPLLDVKLDGLPKVMNNGKILTIKKLLLLLLNVIILEFDWL